jgi:hypothetical protein
MNVRIFPLSHYREALKFAYDGGVAIYDHQLFVRDVADLTDICVAAHMNKVDAVRIGAVAYQIDLTHAQLVATIKRYGLSPIKLPAEDYSI